MNKHIAKLLVIGLFVQFSILAFVYEQDYQGSRDLVDAQRKGCERGKQDREAAAFLNMNILQAFRDTDRRNPNPLSIKRKEALEQIAVHIVGLKERAQIDCAEAFPNPKRTP